MSVCVVPDEGMSECLRAGESPVWKFKLYTGSMTIGKATVLADLTGEASFPGYAAITAVWGAITVPANIATNVQTTATFTRNSPSGASQTVKAWALVNESTGKIVCGRNVSDQVFATTGDSFAITITATMRDA